MRDNLLPASRPAVCKVHLTDCSARLSLLHCIDQAPALKIRSRRSFVARTGWQMSSVRATDTVARRRIAWRRLQCMLDGLPHPQYSWDLHTQKAERKACCSITDRVGRSRHVSDLTRIITERTQMHPLTNNLSTMEPHPDGQYQYDSSHDQYKA